MFGIAARYRMIFKIAEALRKGDMLGLADFLIPKEQDLMFKQCLADLAEQVVIADRLGEIDPAELGTNVRGELLDPHQITKIDEPVVFPASRSRCAWTASSSS